MITRERDRRSCFSDSLLSGEGSDSCEKVSSWRLSERNNEIEEEGREQGRRRWGLGHGR